MKRREIHLRRDGYPDIGYAGRESSFLEKEGARSSSVFLAAVESGIWLTSSRSKTVRTTRGRKEERERERGGRKNRECSILRMYISAKKVRGSGLPRLWASNAWREEDPPCLTCRSREYACVRACARDARGFRRRDVEDRLWRSSPRTGSPITAGAILLAARENA